MDALQEAACSVVRWRAMYAWSSLRKMSQMLEAAKGTCGDC
jgi:hypothetical protein